MIISTTRLAELELRSRNKPSKCPQINGADGVHDYVASAARDGLERWSKRDFPLTIYIKPLSKLGGKTDAPKLLRQSLSEWSNNTNGLITFKEVSNPQEAKINIGWVTAAGGLNEDAEAGEALVEHGNGDIHNARVSIDLRKSDGEPFEGKLRTTMLHELGHV